MVKHAVSHPIPGFNIEKSESTLISTALGEICFSDYKNNFKDTMHIQKASFIKSVQ
jgi:hypothetical protein